MATTTTMTKADSSFNANLCHPEHALGDEDSAAARLFNKLSTEILLTRAATKLRWIKRDWNPYPESQHILELHPAQTCISNQSGIHAPKYTALSEDTLSPIPSSNVSARIDAETSVSPPWRSARDSASPTPSEERLPFLPFLLASQSLKGRRRRRGKGGNQPPTSCGAHHRQRKPRDTMRVRKLAMVTRSCRNTGQPFYSLPATGRPP